MPITREEFYTTDEPFRAATKEIRDFLHAHTDNAYTEAEILEQISSRIQDQTVRQYVTGSNGADGSERDIKSPALRSLVLAGVVEAKHFGSTLYFALRKDLRRN